MRLKRKLRSKDVCEREAISESTLARGIINETYPRPNYDQLGRRWWWESQWDAHDRRMAKLSLGPKSRPPAPTPSSLRKAVKKRIVAVRRRLKAERAGAVP